MAFGVNWTFKRISFLVSQMNHTVISGAVMDERDAHVHLDEGQYSKFRL